MKHPTILTFALTLAVLCVPTGWVVAQDTSWLESVAAAGYSIMASLVPVLISIALLVFIWGIVIFIAKSGDEQAVIEGRKKMIWGVVALFVIVSIWGLVVLLQQLSGVTGTTPTRPSVTISDGAAGGNAITPNSGNPSQPNFVGPPAPAPAPAPSPASGDPSNPTFVGPPPPPIPGGP